MKNTDFTRLFNSLESHILVIDTELKVVAVTKGFVKSSGRTRESMIGKDVASLFFDGAADKNVFPNSLKKVLQTKMPDRLSRVEWNSGSHTTYWNAWTYPSLDENGEVEYLLHETVEITTEVNKEILLNTVEKELLAQTTLTDILDRQSDGFFIMNRSEVLTFVNKYMKDFGLLMNTGELLGRPVKEVFASPDTEKFLQRYRRILDTKVADHFVEILDGRYLSVDAYSTEEDTVAVFFRDVTQKVNDEREIRENRAKLQIITDHIPAFVGYFDTTGTYQFVNKTYEEWFELKAEDIIGKKRSEFATQQTTELAKSHEARALAGETIKYQNILAKQGQTIYLDVSYVPDFDAKTNKVRGAVVIGYDITDEVVARQSMEKALKTREEFMSIASHELKTPLTSMYLTGQHLLRQSKKMENLSSKAVSHYANSVDKNIKRLNRLIDDMLDITRISTGKLSLHPEWFNLTALVTEIIDRHSLQFNEITFNALSDMDVFGDRLRIDQVISNLVSNAIKYGERTPVSITIQSVNNRAVIKVKDNGPGIAEENHERIFQKFERDNVDSNVTGLGLGLFICREIMVRHNGSIKVSSKPGMGSEFTIEFPRILEVAEQRT